MSNHLFGQNSTDLFFHDVELQTLINPSCDVVKVKHEDLVRVAVAHDLKMTLDIKGLINSI